MSGLQNILVVDPYKVKLNLTFQMKEFSEFNLTSYLSKDMKNLKHFSFCYECAHAVFNNDIILSWVPKLKNLFRTLDFISKDPSISTSKILLNQQKSQIRKLLRQSAMVKLFMQSLVNLDFLINQMAEMFSHGETTPIDMELQASGRYTVKRSLH